MAGLSIRRFCGAKGAIALLALMATGSAGAATIYKFTDAQGVVNYTDRQTPGAKVLVFRDRMVERFERQVRLLTQRNADSTRFSVRNDLYAPVQVTLTLSSLGNAKGAAPGTLKRLIAPRSTVELTTLVAQQAGRPLTFKQVFDYAIGDPGKAPLAYAYPLPWVGGPFRLSQGPNGPYSHFGAKSRYAMDIAMPRGTPIIAARAGTVIKIENGQPEGGSEASGNFVRVLHEDGTMGVYLHLGQGTVSVREGQQVSVGTPLGRSGNTGNSSGPHLHFVVQRNVGLALESIPYRFDRPVDVLPNFATRH